MEDRSRKEKRIQMTEIRKEVILANCRNICLHCGKKLTLHDNFTVEHIIPLSKGGSNELHNLVSLCNECNLLKSDNIVPPQFYNKAHKLLYKSILEECVAYYTNHKFLDENNTLAIDSWELAHKQVIKKGDNGNEIYSPEKKLSISVVKNRTEIENFRQSFVNLFKNQTDRRNAISFFDDEAIENKLQKICTDKKILALFDQQLIMWDFNMGDQYYGKALDVECFIPTFQYKIMINPNIVQTRITTGMICSAIDSIIYYLNASLEGFDASGIGHILLYAMINDKNSVRVINQFAKISGKPHESIVGQIDGSDFYGVNFPIVYGEEDFLINFIKEPSKTFKKHRNDIFDILLDGEEWKKKLKTKK